MSKIFYSRLLVCCLFLCVYLKSFSQYSTDSLNLGQDVSRWYDQQLGIDNTQLVLGTYQKIQLSLNSHPFFLEKYWLKGNIEYRGQKFLSVNFRYDTYEDYLIINHPTNLFIGNQPIRLFNSEIESFEINEHHFINLKELTNKNGFYEVLVDGTNIRFVSKRIKTLEIVSNSASTEYKSEDKYFMVVDNQLIAIRNKRNFILLFPEFKKEIKKYTKSIGLMPNTKNEKDMILLAKFCDNKIK